MNLINILFSPILVGFFGGLIRACQGAYKDAPWENFETIKFVRSLSFGTIGGVFWFYFLKNFGLSVHPALLLAMVILFDSITTEIYKRGFRVENLDKYKMPTILHINGKIIHNRFIRGLIGITIYLFVFSLFWLVQYFDKNFITINSQLLWGAFWGLIAGTTVAIGGSLLDTAWEGFEPLKFFRSPIHGIYWGIIFSFFTTNASILYFACLGLDRMSIEFYKSFIRKIKSGKFKSDKPTHLKWLNVREKLLLPYLSGWLFFIFLLIAG